MSYQVSQVQHLIIYKTNKVMGINGVKYPPLSCCNLESYTIGAGCVSAPFECLIRSCP